MKQRLVIEVGGTWTRIGRAVGGRLVAGQKLPTARPWSAARKVLVGATGELFLGHKVQEVVMGLPGVLDQKQTKLQRAPNLPDWQQQPIKQDMRRIYRAPVTLVNDAVLGAVGEAQHGAGKGAAIVGYLSVGTGIGGARVVHGAIDRYTVGFEPGHQIIDQGRTLEELIGGRTLEHRFGTDWSSLTADNWHWIEQWLAIGLVNITNLWSPNRIVLGGSVVQRGRISMVRLRTLLRRWLRTISEPPAVVKASLGDQAGLWGGARFPGNN